MNLKSLAPHAHLVVVAAAAFAAGWYLRPPEVRVVESVKTVETRREVQTVQQTVDLSEFKRLVAEAATKKNVVTIREVVRAPDGTTTEKTRTEDKSETQTKRAEDKSVAEKSSTTAKKDLAETKFEERVKMVETLRRPNWLVSASAGVGIPVLLGSDAVSLVPGLPEAVYVAASASKRLVGPLYSGIEATTRGDVGLRLSLVF